MKNKIMILLLVVDVLLAGFAYYIYTSQDSTPPVITFPETEPTVVNESDSYDEQLLKDVKATDTKDGDVSDTLMIERARVSDDCKSISVVFVAKDKKNNVKRVEKEYDFVPDIDSSKYIPKDQKYKIALINNLGIENLATAWGTKLSKSGHTITSISLSNDPIQNDTVIYVPKEGYGTELLQFFKSAQIVVGNISDHMTANANGADVFVVLGYKNSEVPDI